MAEEAAEQITTETLAPELAAPGSIGAEVPADDKPAAAAPAEGAETVQADAGTEQPADDKPAKEPRDAAIEAMRRRIAQLSAKAAEEAEGKKAVEAELARLRATPAAEPTDADPNAPRMVPEAELDRRAREYAASIAQADRAAERFNDQCNAVAAKGEAEHKDFGAVVRGALGEFAGEQYPALVSAALDTEDASKVLYELGKNLDEAERIMALPPLKRVAEMQKIALKPAPAKKVSQAPAPITPVDGRAAQSDALRDNMDDNEWFKTRNKTAPAHLRYQ